MTDMTIPNILSIFRIILVPVFIFVVLSGEANAYMFGMAVFLLAGFTDVLDGYLARKYNCTSVLGRILDPLADKLMVASALVCAVIEELIPLWLALAYIAKELMQGVGGFLFYNKVNDMIPSNILGKAATTVFYTTIFCVFIIPSLPAFIKDTLVYICASLLIATLTVYVRLGIKLAKKLPKESNDEV